MVQVIVNKPADLAKFFRPTAGRGKTVWPKNPADMLKYGIRWDYDGIITHQGKQCHKFQLQPNAGKIPSSIKAWREANGGTHAVITTMYIPVGEEANKTNFEAAAEEALKAISA